MCHHLFCTGIPKPKLTKGYDVTPKNSSVEQRMKHTPISNGQWSATRGESKFKTTKEDINKVLEKFGLDRIDYKGAIPDFSPVG